MKNSVNEDKLSSGTTSLTYTASQVGTYDITITDTTDAADRPVNAARPLQFRVFVVKDIGAVQNTATTFDTDDTGVQYGYDTQDWQLNDADTDDTGDSYFDFGTTDAPVQYSVKGSGNLYLKLGDRTTTRTKSLFTSSDAPVYLQMSRGTNKVTTYVAGNPGKTAIFIFSGTTSDKFPDIEITGVNNQVGVTSGRLEDPLVVKVTDGNNRPVPGVAVAFASTQNGSMFIPVSGTSVYTTTTDVDLIDEDRTDRITLATSTRPTPSESLWVQTDSSGVAQVYYQLSSTAGDHQATASLQGSPVSISETFDAVADDDDRRASLAIVSMEKATGTGKEGIYYLSVIARSVGGHRIPGVIIEFEALSGSLRPRTGTGQPPQGTGNGQVPRVAESGNEIFVLTGSDGEAEVEYNVGPTDSTKIVTAEVHDEQSDDLEYDFVLDRVTFDVQNATSSRPPADDGGDDDGFTPLTLTVSPTSLTGRPGSTQTISVTASETAQVGNIVFGEFLNAGGSASPSSNSGTFTSVLTLPSTEGQYDLVVGIGSTRRTVTVTVSSTAPGTPTGGTVSVSSITPGSGAPGTPSTVTVTATDEDGDPVANVVVTLRITAGGGTFSPATVTTGANGTATSTLTRGSTPSSNYFITASATGYTFQSGLSSGERLTITGTESPGGGSTPRDAGEADSIDVYDGNNQRGTPNSRLAEPLVIEVVDSNNRPVSRERVTFRTTRGSGQFSPERPRTNATGRAQTRFTPTSSGDIRITATVTGVASRAVFNVTAGAAPASVTKVSGDNQSGSPGSALANPFVVEVKDEDGEVVEGIRVTFSVTAGGGSLSETSATADEDGLAETTLTLGSQVGINSVQASVSGVDSVTFSTSVDAKILVAAANRPMMSWIAGGALYRLAGAKEAKIAEGANGVAIGGGKIYWTSQTSASAGTINSANLDGTDKKTLTSILAVPMGIAVDTAGSKLYWTNSRGRIQSANLNGSSIKNVMQNLSDPTDIVVSNGFIYWTEDGNSVRRVNISGQKIAIDVAVNLNTVGGLAVGGGKVYWTEQTSATAGTVNGANLNGTNFETLATLLSAPMGISVDTAGSKLYWTNARGRVQSANLDGSMIKNVVEGLISPSKIAIGGANTETEVMTRQPTAKKDNAKYDVNGDGKVDNVDASLVASGLDTGNAKYDVDGDGTVNFLDLLLIFDNRDDDAAGAPTVVGMKLSAIQIDVIEEQIDLLIATNDRSPAALRTLVYMQQLLATARPEKTQLFANYPNPFNPETWIPYELATDTHVKITIYNTQGVVIRTLQFGHQSAGYYTDRDRAAYWDGRNALGEQVASGLYFYQLETDEMSSMRKMVILK